MGLVYGRAMERLTRASGLMCGILGSVYGRDMERVTSSANQCSDPKTPTRKRARINLKVLILVNIQLLEKADGHPEIESPKFYVRIVPSIVGLCPDKNPQ